VEILPMGPPASVGAVLLLWQQHHPRVTREQVMHRRSATFGHAGDNHGGIAERIVPVGMFLRFKRGISDISMMVMSDARDVS